MPLEYVTPKLKTVLFWGQKISVKHFLWKIPRSRSTSIDTACKEAKHSPCSSCQAGVHRKQNPSHVKRKRAPATDGISVDTKMALTFFPYEATKGAAD